MKNLKNLTIALTFILANTIFAEIDPKLDSLIMKISGDSIWNNIDTITTFERYTPNPQAIESADFLENFLNSFNYDVVETQTYTSGYTPNIYALKTGKVYPDEYLVICAHYDSYKTGADGADDNGSGVGALMEIAKVFDQYDFDRSIFLAFFSGEELGLYGSEFFADSAVNNNLNILSVINLDVIGYLHPGSPFDFDCSYNSASYNLYNDFKGMVNEYIPQVSIVDATSKLYWQSSDHRSFWDNGIEGLFLAGELDPYSSYFNNSWHSSGDKLGTSANSKELMEAITRSTALYVASEAELNIEHVQIADINSIKSLKSKLGIVSTSQNNLVLSYSQLSDVSVKIFNISGQCIEKISNIELFEGINEISFSNNLAKGYYILEIKNNNIKLKEPFFIR